MLSMLLRKSRALRVGARSTKEPVESLLEPPLIVQFDTMCSALLHFAPARGCPNET